MPFVRHRQKDLGKIIRRAEAALKKGDQKAAEKALRELLLMNPTDGEAADTLGDLLLRQGRVDEAEACFRRNVALHPNSARAHSNLGAALLARGEQQAEAVACFERATQLDPKFAKGYNCLGNALRSSGRMFDAILAFQKALALQPDCAGTLNDLGVVYENCLNYREAKACFEKALKIEPQHPLALNNLAKVVRDQGCIEESIELFRKAMEAKHDYAFAHSNMLFTLHYQPVLDPGQLLNEHKEWAKRHAPPDIARSHHSNNADPDRPLRIGYLTPDIRDHSVAYFLEAILDAHDREQVRPYAYAQVMNPDETTARMKPKFEVYRSTVGRSDEDVVRMALEDQIDIMVDLAGHTASNRLPVMARRPAPIQVTYLGYPDTTGMSVVDYRVTDALADPEGQDVFYTEKLVRLPECFLCYRPPEEAPAVRPPPVLTSGNITFGSFNSLHKVNVDVVRTWAMLLQRVPGSRLLLKSGALQESGIRDRYFGLFADCHIGRDRIVLVSWEPGRSDHLALYGEVDIGLDPFPYHGTTTTCEALWMGVPVVTRRGLVHSSRVGCSLLHQVGLDDLVAQDEEGYLDIAARLAADPQRLASLRTELRTRMKQSVLCNKAVFTRNLEQAYRTMWRTWCLAHGGTAAKPTSEQNAPSCPAQESRTSARVMAVETETPQVPVSGAPVSPNALVAPDPTRPRGAVEEALLADELSRSGKRSKAFEHANAGWRLVRNGRFTKDAPASLLQAWQSQTVDGVLLKQCIALGSASSYFNRGPSKEWFMAWAKLEPNCPEPLFRLGLLWALESASTGSVVPAPAMEALRHAAQLMQDERSAKAVALCSGPLTELSVPYDGGHIHVRPDIRDLTTYVLLEQGDWFDEDLDLFRALVKPGMSVLDLGANIGVYSFSAAQRVGPQGRVASVEPDPSACELMVRTADPFPCWAVCGGEQCRQVSMDGLARQLGGCAFDLIRIDTERYPVSELDGAHELLGARNPVVLYSVRKGSEVNTTLVQAFRASGYESYTYLSSQKALEPLDEQGQLDPSVRNAVAAKASCIEDLLSHGFRLNHE